MRIFEDGENWGRRINFVDDNNVLVGYDWESQCCEGFDYLLSYTPGPRDEDTDIDHEGYNFDVAYDEDSDDKAPTEDKDEYDYGNDVTFRLSKEDKPYIYLVLTNSHNGYYSHGFDMKKDDKIIQSGAL